MIDRETGEDMASDLREIRLRCPGLTPNNEISRLKDVRININKHIYPGLQELILESPNFSGLHSKSNMQWLLVVPRYRTIFVSVTTNGNLGP